MSLQSRIIALAFLLVLFLLSNAVAAEKKYSILRKDDGGYIITIDYKKRIMSPITAEGIFPVVERQYKIEIIGEGKDWSYRNQKGYYYPMEEIKGVDGDIGYIWVDYERNNIYINIYWISSPDGIIPSDINGKYNIDLEK